MKNYYFKRPLVTKDPTDPPGIIAQLCKIIFSVPFLMCAVLVWMIVLSLLAGGCTHAVILPPCGTYDIPVRLHITQDRSTWPTRSQRPEVGGVSSTANEIWLRQEDFADWIRQERNLGHEVEHLINFKYRVFPNPDEVK